MVKTANFIKQECIDTLAQMTQLVNYILQTKRFVIVFSILYFKKIKTKFLKEEELENLKSYSYKSEKRKNISIDHTTQKSKWLI